MTHFTTNEQALLRKLKNSPSNIVNSETSTIVSLIKKSNSDLCLDILSNITPVLNLGKTNSTVQDLVCPLLERMESSPIEVQMRVVDSLGHLAHLYHDPNAEFNTRISPQELPDYNKYELTTVEPESEFYYERLICSFYKSSDELIKRKVITTIGTLVAEYPDNLENEILLSQFVDVLEKEKPIISAAAAQSLGHFGIAMEDPEIFEHLHTALSNNDPWVRAGALHGISVMAIDNPELIDEHKIGFTELLFNDQEIVQRTAVSVLETWSNKTELPVNSILDNIVQFDEIDHKDLVILFDLIRKISTEETIDEEILIDFLAAKPLDTTKEVVCETAGLYLVKIGKQSQSNIDGAISRYLSKLESDIPTQISLACSAIGYIGVQLPSYVDESHSRIAELTDHDSARVRENAVESLGLLGRENPSSHAVFIVPLINCLSDQNSNIRKEAALALQNIGKNHPNKAAEGLQELVASLEDERSEVRTAAAEAIGIIAVQAPSDVRPYLESLINRIETSRVDTQRRLISSIGEIGSIAPIFNRPDIARIREIYNDESRDNSVRAVAASALGNMLKNDPEISPSDVNTFESGLVSNDRSLCVASTEAINNVSIHNPESVYSSVETIVNTLNKQPHGNDDIYANALGQIGVRYPQMVLSSIDPITNLFDANDWSIRKAAVESIGNIGYAKPSLATHNGVFEKLIDKVETGAPFVRNYAIKSIGLICRNDIRTGPEAIPNFVEQLQSSSPLVKTNVAREFPHLVDNSCNVEYCKELYSEAGDLGGKALTSAMAAIGKYGVISPITVDSLLERDSNGATDVVKNIAPVATLSPSWIGTRNSEIIVSSSSTEPIRTSDSEGETTSTSTPKYQSSSETASQSPNEQVVSPPRVNINPGRTENISNIKELDNIVVDKKKLSDTDIEYVSVMEPNDENKHSKSVKKPRINKLIKKTQDWEEIKNEERQNQVYNDYEHIRAIIDKDEDIGRLYLEYMDISVRELLNNNRTGLSIPRGLWIAEGIAKGLEIYNNFSVNRYNVKPRNVMLYERAGEWEWPKLTPWGITGAPNKPWGEDDSPITSYTAPEQLDDTDFNTGQHTEIYQLGVFTFELLTGNKPMHQTPERELRYKLIEESPVQDTIAENDHIPDHVIDELVKATSKDPTKRHDLIYDLRIEITSILQNL